jgi:hypothetical protein
MAIRTGTISGIILASFREIPCKETKLDAKREDFKQAVKVAAAQMAARGTSTLTLTPRQALIAVNSAVPREITSRHLLLRLKKILQGPRPARRARYV